MAQVAVAVSTVRNGSMYTPDDQEDADIIQNRTTWLAEQGVAIDDATRLHVTYDGDDFCRYRIVDASSKGEGMKALGIPADALVTTTPGQALFLPVADCVATTIFDEEHGVLMLSHLGRHSLEQQGGAQSVEFLVNNFSTNPENLKVWLAPAPNKEVYPIFKLGGQGMKEAALDQLQKAGVLLKNITDNPADTATDDNYYSHSEYLKGNKSSDGRFAMMAVIN